jgi:outer membrane protein OmpA-like peptidoglycan-associated protein
LAKRPLTAGRTLSATTRAHFEDRFGADFSDIRIHDRPEDADLAADLGARAFTIGRDIWLGSGAPSDLGSVVGRRLLAHELTHAIQQRRAPRPQTVLVDGGTSTAPAEREAISISEIVAAGGAAPPIAELAAEAVQRQPLDPSAAPPMTREEEIARSRGHPGAVTITVAPPAISLFEFAINDDHLKPVHERLIALLGPILAIVPSDVIGIEIAGHADATGGAAVNDPLSLRRARRIAAALGVAAQRSFDASGHGENEPVTSNDTVEARARNRRVDIRFLVANPPTPTPTPPGPGPGPGPGPQPPGPQPPGPQPPGPQPPGPQPPGPQPPGPTDPGGVCEQHPILCILGALAGALGVGALAAGLLDLLTGIGIGELLDFLRRLFQRPPGPPVPPGPPRPPNPPNQPTPPLVVIGPVRHFNTPAGMPDRIPPGARTLFTPAAVAISGLQPGSPPVVIEPVGGPRSGSATVDGAASTSMTTSGFIRVAGTAQTSPGARSLNLRATFAGTPIASSPNFAVAALPVFMRQSFHHVIQDAIKSGIVVAARWSSDSGSRGDLDEVFIEEAVQLTSRPTGCFLGKSFGIPPPIQATKVGGDEHGARKDVMQSPGVIAVQQTHKILDRRTLGTGSVPFPSSGYGIRLEVTDPNPQGPTLDLNVRKFGRGGTATGVTSGAGVTFPSSGIDETVAVPRIRFGPPPPPTPPPRPSGGGGRPGPSGGTAATPVTPRPYVGPPLTGTSRLFYVSGLPNPPATGSIHRITGSFRSASGIHTVELDYRVTDVTSTMVELQSTNLIPLNIAPASEPPLVVNPLSSARVRRSAL